MCNSASLTCMQERLDSFQNLMACLQRMLRARSMQMLVEHAPNWCREDWGRIVNNLSACVRGSSLPNRLPWRRGQLLPEQASVKGRRPHLPDC